MTDNELKALYDRAQEHYRKAAILMAEWREGVQKQIQDQVLKEAQGETRRSR